MKVKAGHKQTDVGVIPNDWDTIRISEACLKVQDGTHFSPRGGGNDFLYVTSRNIRHGYLDISTAAHIDAVQHRQIYRRCDVRKGDLLLTKDGANTGNAALNTLDEEFSLLSSVAMLRFAEGQHCAAYFLQQIISSDGQRQIQEAMAGNAITRLTLEKIKKLSFPIPATKAEQKVIAGALRDADALIESLELLLAKKRQVKQGAMQELLTGKKRLPGFARIRGLRPSEVGRIPEDWEVAMLGTLLRRPPTYGINAAAVPFDSRFPTYVRITDITENGRLSDANRVSVAHPSAARYVLEPGDIVFARTGASVGKSYLFDPEDGGLVFAGFLIRLTPDPARLEPSLLSFFAQSSPYWNWVRENSMRSGQPGINAREFASLLIPLPPTRVEQTAIAAVLSDIDAEVAALEARLAKARQIKQGMMQELLTGRIRLV